MTLPWSGSVKRAAEVGRLTVRALGLVWSTSPRLFLSLTVLTIAGGLLPAAVALVGKQIVDGVILAAETGSAVDREAALDKVALEGGLIILLAAMRRGADICDTLMRATLGNTVNVMILRKALELELPDFEDSETYDRMTRARREASRRPLGLVRHSLTLIQNVLSLIGYGAILLAFSPLAVLGLTVAAFPSFIAETRFASHAHALFSWRSADVRMQNYLEVVVAREDHAKEVKLLGIGPRLVDRYDRIFRSIFQKESALVIRRGAWGLLLGAISTLALYGAYGWIAASAIAGSITLGSMTMYLLVFKQGQAALGTSLQAIGGIHEDSLYMADLYTFLEQKVTRPTGRALSGPLPDDGLRFEGVSFTYPGATAPSVEGLDLHVRPGTRLAIVGHNGSGKTTLIKLLTGLYTPTAGRVTWEGRDLREWDPTALRDHLGVIFQDFVKYQLTVGENIGVGDREHLDDEAAQRTAADQGMATPFIDEMPRGFRSQLGKWFKEGRELSIGQWQKIALARAFMRKDSRVVIFDEPTSAMDAEAEAQLFDRVRELTRDQIAILISHRFSTVRSADRIIVLHGGRNVEDGDHASLMALDGRYARLFSLQAEGYR
jgi:ATP-binding cassette subfamily B protein